MLDAHASQRQDQRSDRTKDGSVLIYFFGTEDEAAIKVGKTRQAAHARKAQHEHRGRSIDTLHFLAGVRGHDRDEKQIKRHFEGLRLHERSTEWLRADAPLVDYLRWLLGQPFVAGDIEECTALELEPSESWLPGDGRSTESAQLPLDFGPWASLARGMENRAEDFYTSSSIIERAHAVMGGIDLDPASHRVANRVVKAKEIFTANENGLLLQWKGRVWLNPPYGNWQAWTPKALGEWASGRVSQMCVLVATRSLTTQVVAPLFDAALAICITYGRIPFWGRYAAQPDDGHAILYFGQNLDQFSSVFSEIGTVFTVRQTYTGVRA